MQIATRLQCHPLREACNIILALHKFIKPYKNSCKTFFKPHNTLLCDAKGLILM